MSEKSGSETCSEFAKCLEYLYLMLDNEASEDQKVYLKNHLEKCIFCFEQYEVEQHLRDLIKTTFLNLPVPEGLANDIKVRVFQTK